MNKDNAKDWDNASAALNDPLTDLLKSGARALIQQAVEAELHAFLGEYAKVTDLRGRQTVVRNGYLPEREIVTGVGNVTVKIPKVRDRSGGGVKFNSSLVPPYVRKAKRIEAALPWLYLHGISTGNMQAALSVLLGDDAKGLSPAVVSRLKAQWAEDYLAWNRRDLSKERYVYVWADGIYSTLRGEDDRLCLLVIIGVNAQGEKRLLALSDGYRESKASWLSVLQDLQTRGLQNAPKLATGDGALGFWAAINEAWPSTKHQRCWVHKTANVLAALPDSMRGKAKAGLKEIWMADTKAQANKAFDTFLCDNLCPVLFIPHGGGPLPLLGDAGHQQLVDFLQSIPARIRTPAAICVISAHWEESIATITGNALPSLIYDYYGFPDRAYAIQYPAPGSPNLARKIFAALQQSGIPAHLDEQRGYDHGLLVPLKLMFPDAGIPCMQLSLLSNLDPAAHIAIGKALRPLRRDNVLFIGSGFSFHNMKAFFTGNHGMDEQNNAFQEWLIDICTNPKLSFADRSSLLIAWERAPAAHYCHPREEHLLPLHVCVGISNEAAELVFDGEVLGKKACGLIWR